VTRADAGALYGVAFYGTTTIAMQEALDKLAAEGIELDTMRVRAFPFGEEVADFLDRHSRVFVVEQNRDGQMRKLFMTELDADPAKLEAVTHYDGLPITPQFIYESIKARLSPASKTSRRSGTES
ncbi:MAG: 2-oxoacid:acceptor oxidoreductase subunit alpha, partial [Gammaproteobacteria bacterium]|nr:2-oxoacid:acceptor oxidoreductase subunit alpha [Gammaproteobacteria bacterium]